MSKSGFTLIELLAVLVLLAVVAVIAVTSGMSILNSSKASLSDTQKDTIIDAAKNYQSANGITDTTYVSLGDLSDGGYLDSSELKDPKTGDKIEGGVCIKYIYAEKDGKVTQNKYTFEYQEENNCKD